MGWSSWLVSLSADGRRAAGLVDRQTWVWDCQTGECLHRLGTLGGRESHVGAISENGKVLVGWADAVDGRNVAYRWSEEGGMRPMTEQPFLASQAQFVSADGAVATGLVEDSRDAKQVFRWSEDGGMQLTGMQPDFVTGLSADGTVIVGCSLSPPAAYRWTEATGTMNLGADAGLSARANAASSDGMSIVGIAAFSPRVGRAFHWSVADGFLDLGTLGGRYSEAKSISPNGQVVFGWSETAKRELRLFRWTKSGGMQQLGETVFNLESVWRLDFNDVSESGNVAVGKVPNAKSRTIGFVWASEEGLVETADLGDYENWLSKVSADGRVIGGTGTSRGGRHRAFLIHRGDLVDGATRPRQNRSLT